MINDQILQEATLDQTLSSEGYVVIPFLDAAKVKTLVQFFYDHHPADIPGFYASAHSQDIAFRNLMNDKIKEVFSESIENTFTNHESLGGSFVVKSKDQKERLHPHQDWNIVNEEKYRSFNIWVPLVNTTQENGAIRVLPKSHLWGLNYRGPNISDNRNDQVEDIWEKMKTLEIKAGEALIYDHRLYHASFPNIQETYRLAAVFGIKPKEADMFYYYGRDNNIEIYKSSIEFFMTGDIQNGPETLELVASIKTKATIPVNQDKSPERPSIFSKLKRLFNFK